MKIIDSKQINWTVVCVYEFAKYKAMNPKTAFQFLVYYGGIQFLKEHYEVEHMLSIDDTIEALDIICRKNGGHK